MAGRHGGGDYSRPDSSDYDRLYQQPTGQYQQPPQGYGPPQQQYPYAQPDPYQPGYQQRQPQQGYYPQAGYAPRRLPRKRRRVFMWVFFAIQALFLIWLISVLAAGHTSNAQTLAQNCTGHNWYPIFKSQADCMTHYNVALNDAQNIGKGLGVVFVIIVWMVVDFFVGLGYGIYRLATRSR